MANKGEVVRKKVCRECTETIKCSIFWGKSCNRNGGKKIPRFRIIEKPKYKTKPKRDYWSGEQIRVISGF